MKRQVKGSWVNDPYLSFISGEREYAATAVDAQKFFLEIEGVHNNFFPYEKRFESSFLTIKHPNDDISRELNSYFISDRGYGSDLYGDHCDLPDFFGGVLQRLLIYGKSFCALDWEKVSIAEKEYILPTRFRYLPPSTMTPKLSADGSINGYTQEYSFWARYFTDRKSMLKKAEFHKNEIFHTTYPLGNRHPVKKSLGLLPELLNFWSFGLNKSEASVNTRDHRLGLEKARVKRYSQELRKHSLSRARVRKNFHWLLNVEDLKITEYYDLFLVTRYRKNLNTVRQYFVDQFNEQILQVVAQKNKIKLPILQLTNLMTNMEVEQYFNDYRLGKINSQDFIDKAVNKN